MAHQNACEALPPVPGILPGTIIYTLDGALPVEYLTAGDRIITRAGARILRDVTSGPGGLRLHFDGPEVVYGDGFEVLAA